MSYISVKRKSNKKTKIFMVVIVAVLCILFRKPIFSLFGNGVSVVANPVWGVGEFFKGEITESILSIQSKKSLVRKLLDLQDDFMVMSTLRDEKDVLIDENLRLKKLLGIYQLSDFDATARVLSRPPVVSYDNVLIDKGQKDGVLVGDRVFASGDVYIGVVQEAYLDSSLVELLSTSKKETEVKLSSSDLALTLIGRGGGSFSVSTPRSVSVDENNFFVAVFGGESIVAEVVRVTGDPQDPIKTVLAKTPFNINNLNYVFLKRF